MLSRVGFTNGERNFQTDHQGENVLVASFIAVDLTHAAGGETVEPRLR